MVDSYTLNGRIWIENSAEKVFGPGRVELLGKIQATGSIRQAALQMKMSYKQAWGMINHMNTNFTAPVVISKRGGKGGGNAEVTQHGINAIARFYALKQKFSAFLEDINQSIVL